MKASVFALFVMAALTLLSFSFSCTKPIIETRGGNPLREGEIDMPWDPPWHKPAPFEDVFDRSDLIVFAQVVEVVNEIDIDELRRKDEEEPPLVGVWPFFPEQAGSIKVLRVLKGPQELTSEVINIEKKRSTYFLKVGRERVFFLEMRDGQYHTLVRIGGTGRLGSGLAAIRGLKLERGELKKGGVAFSVLSEAPPLEGRRIHIFRGRLRAPVKIGDRSWEEYRIKALETDEFGVSAVELPNGFYTVLLELEGNLYSHHPRYPKGMVNGYYAVLIVEDNWRPISFCLERIRDKKRVQ